MPRATTTVQRRVANTVFALFKILTIATISIPREYFSNLRKLAAAINMSGRATKIYEEPNYTTSTLCGWSTSPRAHNHVRAWSSTPDKTKNRHPPS